eukprot:746830-Hanusia_phi.AAC.2
MEKQRAGLDALQLGYGQAIKSPLDADARMRIQTLHVAVEQRDQEILELRKQLEDAVLNKRRQIPLYSGQQENRERKEGGRKSAAFPLFNMRTDDIPQVATVALFLLCLDGLVIHVQDTYFQGDKGGVLGFVFICGSLFAVVFVLLTLFKFFLRLLGERGQEVRGGEREEEGEGRGRTERVCGREEGDVLKQARQEKMIVQVTSEHAPLLPFQQTSYLSESRPQM